MWHTVGPGPQRKNCSSATAQPCHPSPKPPTTCLPCCVPRHPTRSAARSAASSAALSAALVSPAVHGAPSCTARTGAVAPPIVKLYTSEDCSSCPPADKWLYRLNSDPSVVALAFHVDYWDRLGWKDRFASGAQPQRRPSSNAAAARASAIGCRRSSTASIGPTTQSGDRFSRGAGNGGRGPNDASRQDLYCHHLVTGDDAPRRLFGRHRARSP